MTAHCIPENFKVVETLSPAADAGGRTGSYVSLKNCHKATFVFHVTQGNAATIALSFSAASDVAGTGAAAMTGLARIWSDLDCAASDALVRRSDAASYTTDAGVKHKIVIVEVDPLLLIAQNAAFDCIAPVTGASNAANITQCLVYLEGRYQQATPPTSVTD